MTGKLIGCVGHDCEECQKREAQDKEREKLKAMVLDFVRSLVNSDEETGRGAVKRMAAHVVDEIMTNG